MKFNSWEWYTPILKTLLQIKYSQTSRKRPPEMQRRLSGHLRELVAYKNRTIGGLIREEVLAHLHIPYGRQFITPCVGPWCH